MDRRQDDRGASRLAGVAVLGFVLVMPPLLTIFDKPGDTVLGIPLAWAYLLTAWALIIALVAVAVGRR